MGELSEIVLYISDHDFLSVVSIPHSPQPDFHLVLHFYFPEVIFSHYHFIMKYFKYLQN